MINNCLCSHVIANTKNVTFSYFLQDMKFLLTNNFYDETIVFFFEICARGQIGNIWIHNVRWCAANYNKRCA